MKSLLAITLLLIIVSVAGAQNKTAFPCKEDPARRQFDFWVGEWDVYNKAGKLVGHSVVQNVSGECMILENWTSAGGNYEGKSVNFYNAETKKWEQHWVGSQGDVAINSNGEFKDGAMRFVRETKAQDGSVLLNHFDFYNLGPDKVRQHLETSKDNGTTWVTSFDYTYVRRKA
ncbi:MAG TPA: hypothetical protein VFE50_07640 [Cyclobacteriaceae bacterium]|nr:hypothetical protein [Cyclobacteriaceae bacterium]